MKKWLLAAIILLGLGLRLWGNGFGLPGVFLSDETMVVHKAIAMGSGDLNPHFFAYPTFHIYIVAFVYGLLFVLGRFFGLINSVQDFQTLFFADPTLFYFTARCLSALFSTASIWVIWKIGKRVYSEWTGLLGALLISLCYIHVRWAHFVKVEAALTFWTALCILFLCKLAEQPKSSWRPYLWTGIVWGLGMSTKYTAVYLGVPFLFVHFWRLKRLAFQRAGLPEHGKFLCAIGMAALTFFITSPFVVLNYKTFLFYFHKHTSVDIALSFSFSRLVHSFLYISTKSVIYAMGLPLALLAVIGLVSSFFKKNDKELILTLFLLAYFFFFLSNIKPDVFPIWYIDPLWPVFCLFAASACRVIFQFLNRHRWRMKEGIIIALLVVSLWPSLKKIFQENQLLCRKDTRIQAREWIHNHIPSGTKLAIYGVVCYSPPLFESKNLIQEKHHFVTTLGAIRGGNYSNIFAGPRRFAVKLAQPNYPPLPNYYIYRLWDTLEKIEIPKTWHLRADSEFDKLKAKGIKYIILTSHPVSSLSHTSQNLKQIFRNQAELLIEFNPLNAGATTDKLRYNPAAFLVPMNKHSLLKHPGPRICIYKI